MSQSSGANGVGTGGILSVTARFKQRMYVEAVEAMKREKLEA